MTTKKYNEENIRVAAYYNWKNAGCPSGNDEYFWNQAINQLYGSSKTSSCSCKRTTKKSTTAKSSASKSATKTTSSAKISTGMSTNTNKKTSSK